MKKIEDMTLKEVKEYYDSDKCDCCSKGEYCPLHAGNCCLCDIVGLKSDRNINDIYKTQLGIPFNENLKVKEIIELLMNKEVEVDETI